MYTVINSGDVLKRTQTTSVKTTGIVFDNSIEVINFAIMSNTSKINVLEDAIGQITNLDTR